jgi:hypothetical protein
MAARGARSRKVVQQEIQKENSKQTPSRFISSSASYRQTTNDSSRVMSPVASWGRTRKQSMNSADSIRSGESSSGRASSSLGHHLTSAMSNMSLEEQKKFIAKGKMTSAPRGRGGGVPLNKSIADQDRHNVRSARSRRTASGAFRSQSRATIVCDTDIAAGMRTWDKTKVWHGGLTAPKPFRGFEHVSYTISLAVSGRNNLRIWHVAKSFQLKEAQ